MEGPSLRSFPRMVLDVPIELRVDRKAIRIKKGLGNLSAGGLFLAGQDWPTGTPVHVRIAGPEPFEADGVIRYREAGGSKGVGIEFTALSEAEHRHLDALIGELTLKGASAA